MNRGFAPGANLEGRLGGVLDEPAGTTYPGMAWEPKAAFAALAEHYAG
jgi:hypothetical protein